MNHDNDARATSHEIGERARFEQVRYAQVWEDADTLLEGLDIQAGDTCIGISSAGDNCLAMLTRNPGRVIAVDLNPAQLACLELRVAAYRRLAHAELLMLLGCRPCEHRLALYRRCRDDLSPAARAFWDARAAEVSAGIGSAGRFERYFRLFRERVLPLVHGRRTVEALLEARDPDDRRRFFDRRWDTWRWRWLFRLFFSRFVMGRAGRDPAFFDYVEGSVAERLLARTRHALRELDPSTNPYLHWILTGTHGEALPLALREEHFETIRSNLDRLSWTGAPLETVLDELGPASVDRLNLSDIFEYMGPATYAQTLERVSDAMRPGARVLYWNMLVERSRPESLADRLRSLTTLGRRLLDADKAWFYSRVVVEERLA